LIDLLKNIPSVTVDQDGNVSLRGNQNVKILIDGKPFGLEGSGRNTILAQIPSNSVESVELITNPSAKYEAEGSTGIINVVMKKNSSLGYNGNLGLNAGTGDKWNGLINLSMRKDKINLFGNYNYSLMNFVPTGTASRTNYFSTSANIIDETSSGASRNSAHFVKLGTDYSFNARNQFSLTFNLMRSIRTRTDNKYTHQFDQFHILTSDFASSEESNENNFTFDLSANFTHKFEKPNHLLTAEITYSKDKKDGDEDNIITYYTLSNQNPNKTKEFEHENNHNLSGQADYVLPFSKDSKLEAGYRGSYKQRDNDYELQRFDTNSNSYITDYNFTNRFIYKEHVEALYGIYTGKIWDLGFSAGMRAEGTFTKSELLNTNQNFDKKYFGIFPSASISYKLTKMSEIQLSYARRMNRPRPNQLNPFVKISDPNNYFSGNPDLNPEYTDTYELSFIQFLPSITITPTLFYRYTKDEIARIRTLIDSVTAMTTFVNYNKSENYGIELMLNTQPFKFWSLNGTFSYFNRMVDAANISQGLTNEGSSWTARGLTTVTFPLDINLQLAYFYSGKRFTAQGTVNPFRSLDAALKKDFFDRKLSVTFRVSDLFNTQKFVINISDPEFSEYRERKRDSRTFYLNVSYTFGDADKSQDKRRKKDGKREDEGDDIDY
ncbi:MAG: TonB-dependent receptor domain-containing protein, partial [Ignavibacteria bacterium]